MADFWPGNLKKPGFSRENNGFSVLGTCSYWLTMLILAHESPCLVTIRAQITPVRR
jgi:hypothetical protein